MRNFQHKRGWKDIMQSKPVLVFMGILILFFAWSVLGLWGKMGETAKNKEIAEDKVASLKAEKEKLNSEIDSLKTDEGKEKFFRENLGLAKEGEGLIIVVEDKDASNTGKGESGGFFSFFKNLFK